MAAYSAILKGAGRVWVVDRHPDRLALADKIGAIPIDDSAQDPVQVIKDATLGLGADNGCECVGYQAHDPQGNEDASLTLNTLIDAVRFTGKIGCVGVFVPQDPGGREKQRAGELEAEGKLPLDFGMMWFKGQTIGTGQCPVKKYNRALRDLVAGGKARPSFIVSHEQPLDRAPEAYRNFDSRENGWTKSCCTPENGPLTGVGSAAPAVAGTASRGCRARSRPVPNDQRDCPRAIGDAVMHVRAAIRAVW